MKVTLITARLRFDTAGGVTGTEARDDETNRSVLPIRTDPNGKPALPGTTIAGNLRAHCAAIDADLGALFGDTPEQLAEKHHKAERDGMDPERATPSAIQVLGTVLHQGGDLVSHSRNTADRHRGAARTHHVHRVDMLQAGTAFDVMLRWDNPDPTLLRQHFLPALKQWHPMLGRGVTRGAGQCSLIGWGTADYDLDHADGLLAWLCDTELESYPQPCEEPTEPEHQHVLDADLSIMDGIHCGTEQAAPTTGGERNNQLAVFRHGQEFVVPGSTLKGILRTRSEYICRVLGLAACQHQQCGNCRPCRLFGFSGDETAQRGRIAVDDATIHDAESEFRPHAAINRFTGGAREQALYERELVTAGTFPLRVRWIVAAPHPSPGANDSAATSEAEQDARMLHAALDDMHDGYLGIGSRTTAGNGTVHLETYRTNTFERTELAGVLRNPVAASTEKERE